MIITRAQEECRVRRGKREINGKILTRNSIEIKDGARRRNPCLLKAW